MREQKAVAAEALHPTHLAIIVKMTKEETETHQERKLREYEQHRWRKNKKATDDLNSRAVNDANEISRRIKK